MIYGKVEAEIEDAEHGRVRVTVTHDPVSIKQGDDLIRLSRRAARELAGDLQLCLDELEGAARRDALWSTERRTVLRNAIAKAMQGKEARQKVPMHGLESEAMVQAALCWADMMDALDQAARSGELDLAGSAVASSGDAKPDSQG